MVNELPDTLFRVRVPTIATYSEAEYRAFGIPVSSYDGKRCKMDAEEMTTVHLPLTRIIDIYSNGMPIMLVDKTQLHSMYTSIEKYLSNVIEDSNFSLNRLTITEDRIPEIEKFVEEMFGHNKAAIVKTLISNNKSGFDLGLDLFKPKVSIDINQVQGRGSILDNYDDATSIRRPEHNNNTFIDNNSLPTLDMESVRRKRRMEAYNID